MKKNDNLKRSGFHSIESIIKNNDGKNGGFSGTQIVSE